MPRSPLLVWDAGGDNAPGLAAFFVRTWAEEVQRLAPTARSLRQRHDRVMYASELGEDWSPSDDDIAPVFRQMWAAQATLVWAAHQLEQWLARYASETNQAEPERTPGLHVLRNALEHLYGAQLADGHASAVAGDQNWSLRNLPGSELFIGSGGTADLFGMTDIDHLEKVACEVLIAFMPPELDASDVWDMTRDDR